jgi:hypothetical protein
MHVCKATNIQDYKIIFQKSWAYPDFWEKNLKNGRVFWAKLQLFVVQPKFDQKFKNSKRTWLGKVWTNKKWPETLTQRLCMRIDGAYCLDRSAEIIFSEQGFQAPSKKSQNSSWVEYFFFSLKN